MTPQCQLARAFHIVMRVDVSPVELGATLCQDQREATYKLICMQTECFQMQSTAFSRVISTWMILL